MSEKIVNLNRKPGEHGVRVAGTVAGLLVAGNVLTGCSTGGEAQFSTEQMAHVNQRAKTVAQERLDASDASSTYEGEDWYSVQTDYYTDGNDVELTNGESAVISAQFRSTAELIEETNGFTLTVDMERQERCVSGGEFVSQDEGCPDTVFSYDYPSIVFRIPDKAARKALDDGELSRKEVLSLINDENVILSKIVDDQPYPLHDETVTFADDGSVVLDGYYGGQDPADTVDDYLKY